VCLVPEFFKIFRETCDDSDIVCPPHSGVLNKWWCFKQMAGEGKDETETYQSGERNAEAKA
jgi:hypothetical protein